MAKISFSEFNNLKDRIKVAQNQDQFQMVYRSIISFCPDSNILELAKFFNSHLQNQLPALCSPDNLLDIDHIEMLIALQESARAVKQHIGYRKYDPNLMGEPLNFNLHLIVMNNRIEELNTNTNYSYYCQYYLENIFRPYAEHHPKINHNPPSCVTQLLCQYSVMDEIRAEVDSYSAMFMSR